MTSDKLPDYPSKFPCIHLWMTRRIWHCIKRHLRPYSTHPFIIIKVTKTWWDTVWKPSHKNPGFSSVIQITNIPCQSKITLLSTLCHTMINCSSALEAGLLVLSATLYPPRLLFFQTKKNIYNMVSTNKRTRIFLIWLYHRWLHNNSSTTNDINYL